MRRLSVVGGTDLRLVCCRGNGFICLFEQQPNTVPFSNSLDSYHFIRAECIKQFRKTPPISASQRRRIRKSEKKNNKQFSDVRCSRFDRPWSSTHSERSHDCILCLFCSQHSLFLLETNTVRVALSSHFTNVTDPPALSASAQRFVIVCAC